MAISTYKIFLMKKTDATWGNLLTLKEFPDLEVLPKCWKQTTLSDSMQTYIPGIQVLWTLLSSQRIIPRLISPLYRHWKVWKTSTLYGLVVR